MSPLLRRGPDTRPRAERTGRSPFAVGAVVLVVMAIGVWFGFTKDIPFTEGYRLKAAFSSANSIRNNSPVRIAGVNVGKVKSVERQEGTNAAIVTMEIKDSGLPIHKDAQLKIRPRIFLEGNFFVELQPGSPSAPLLDSGDTVPITQTAEPVQLDQVLTALQTDTREDLKDLLEGYGEALTRRPTAAEDAGHDPDVRGETAAESLNDAARYAADAFRSTAIVNQAFLGREPRDLSRLIAGLAKVTKALDANEAQLQDLITNFDTTVTAFASEAGNLRTTIGLLPGTLRSADRALDSLNAALPPTRAFAREILPGVRETPATIDASFPWIAQTRRLLSRAELRGLVQDLRPAVNNLARVTDSTIELLPQANLVAQCATKVIFPTGDIKIEDGTLSSGRENYKSFWYTMVGLAGEGQNFDGNGPYVRFQPGGGDQTFSTGRNQATGDRLFGNAAAKPIGTRPAFPGRRPPYRPDAACKDQKIPDLNGARVGPADGAGNPTPQPSSGPAPGGTSPLPALPGVPGLPRGAKAPGATKEPSIAGALIGALDPLRGAGSR